MSDYLVIVESPGKLKSISKFLGKRYSVAASVGHVRDLPKSKMGVDIENNYEPQYITIRGKGALIANLKKQAKSAKKVFLATDPDREGEAISWHLANLLGINEDELCRITFNEITKDAVQKAVKSPRKIDMDLVDAQQARRVLDRVVGYSISPLLWRKVRKGLSAGRVQSVAVRLIVDREREIEAFEPKEYWSLIAQLSKKSQQKKFQAKFYGDINDKIELTCKEDVDAVLKRIENKDFVVKSVKKGVKKRNPSPPFITSTLQQEASRKLGFPTRKTMTVAQKLYESVEIKGAATLGLITYMRTDSMRLSQEALEGIKNHIISTYGEEYYERNKRVFKNRNSSQDAHEAIRPTYWDMTPERVKASLTPEQYKLYKLIWDRTIASQMSSAIYDTVNADIGVDQFIFKAVGSTVKFKGFMLVYTESKDDESGKEKDVTVPDLEVGEILNLKDLLPEQNFTNPPSRYTEASLVRAMEELGIGRPSTYAATISTILARDYIVKEKKILYPTELGSIVTDLMKEHFTNIVDVNFTANMEMELDEIEEGKREWKKVIDTFYKPFAQVLDNAQESIGHVELPVEVSDVICEHCGRNMVVKDGKYGKFLACPGFPECRNIKPIIEEAGVNCPICGKRVIVRKSKRGKKYYPCERGKECGFVAFDKPTGDICPKCGKGLIITRYFGRKPILQCSNNDCDYKPEGEKKVEQP